MCDQIDHLSEERSRLRSAGDHAGAKALDGALADLYEAKRCAGAINGTPEQRDRVRAAAKIDERLEKEILRNG